MLKAVNHAPSTQGHRKRWKPRRPLRTISMLPTLLTLGNLMFGVAAIYYCGREMQHLGVDKSVAEALILPRIFPPALAPTFLSIAVWMIFGGMIMDTLDGRVARKTGQASNFGVQLDSLADIVSFGVAPAIMAITLIHRELFQWQAAPLGFVPFGKAAVFLAFVYVCCAALRLARFNVETTMDEASHEGFRGLPSPGAAAALITTVFLHEHLEYVGRWTRTANTLTTLMPLLTLGLGLLMVSRVRYIHAAHLLLRRRPFWHVVAILLSFVLLLMFTEQVTFVIAWTFVLSGPVAFVLRKTKEPPEETEGRETPSEETSQSLSKRQAT
ncbi:MAG: CDP-diacylglycerol--serine O-phosphatidyltransferase [Phycisphaerales bacterium]|nr:CDP-diacylglycerol--serine O-phosphatidyltransferase [Phycisphaerales bacterium]